MNKNAQKAALKSLNEIRFVRYLEVLGFIPQIEEESAYWYASPFVAEENPSLKIDLKTNEFTDADGNLQGSLVGFACLLYRCTPEGLLNMLDFTKLGQLV